MARTVLVRSIRPLVVFLLAVHVVPAVASAEAASDRWVPGLSLVTGALVHEREGTIESAERGLDDGESRPAIAFLGVGSELSTPETTDRFGRPRLFVRTNVTWTLDTDEGLVNQDDPGVPEVPPINNFPVLGVPGQGQSMRVRTAPLAVDASVGVAFSVDAFGRSLRIKPSVGWIWQQDEINLRLGHVESEGANPDFCSPCRTVFIDDTTTEDRHGLGPGLEIEMDAARANDLVVTLFAGFEAHRLLGDGRVDLDAEGTWTTNGAPSAGRAPTTLDGVYERSDWSYRVAVVRRVLGRPED